MRYKIIVGTAKKPNRYFINGLEVTKKRFDADCASRVDAMLASGQILPSQSPKAWPMASCSAGVHPSQIEEAMQADRELGVQTDYQANGDPIFRDARHRNDWLKAHGMHDRNGGYTN